MTKGHSTLYFILSTPRGVIWDLRSRDLQDAPKSSLLQSLDDNSPTV